MHIWEKCDGIPGTPVVARQASYEEKRTKQFKCRSTMDIDYIFWCQVAILEVQYYT